MSTPSTDNKNQSLYNELWDDATEFYRANDPTYAFQFDLIRRALARTSQPAAVVLDVGCGDGTKTAFLKSLFPDAEVLGVDFSQTGIDYANAHYAKDGLRYECVSASAKDIFGRKHDLITTLEVLEHLEGWEGVLNQICESSSRYVLISVPCGKLQKQEYELLGHFRRFKRGQLEDHMAGQGYKPLEVYYAGWPFFNIMLWLSLNSALLKRAFNSNIKHAKENWVSSLYSGLFRFLYLHLTSRRRFGVQFMGLFEKA